MVGVPKGINKKTWMGPANMMTSLKKRGENNWKLK